MHSPSGTTALSALGNSRGHEGRLDRLRNRPCEAWIREGGEFADQLVRHPSSVVARAATPAVDVAVGTFEDRLDAVAREAKRAQVDRLLAHFPFDGDLHHFGEVFDVIGQVGMAPGGG